MDRNYFEAQRKQNAEFKAQVAERTKEIIVEYNKLIDEMDIEGTRITEGRSVRSIHKLHNFSYDMEYELDEECGWECDFAITSDKISWKWYGTYQYVDVDSIPTDWIFDPDWKDKARQGFLDIINAKADTARKAEVDKEARERVQYEKLRKKYD